MRKKLEKYLYERRTYKYMLLNLLCEETEFQADKVLEYSKEIVRLSIIVDSISSEILKKEEMTTLELGKLLKSGNWRPYGNN